MPTRKKTSSKSADPEISAAQDESASDTPEISAPPFPAIPASGQWTPEEHDQAVAAYQYALDTGDPDAGRMRTVIGLFRNVDRDLIGERVKI